ncbi:MAG: HflK protein, partial [Rhodobacteraceae bacterium]|nr:HflK protein [Paracoccaceae bacterium]
RIVQEAEAYRAQTVNEAQGDASRFSAVRTEYAKAPDVTRRRLYLETMERVLGGANKVIMDEPAGQGAATLPVLPLTDLLGKAGAKTDVAKSGGNN